MLSVGGAAKVYNLSAGKSLPEFIKESLSKGRQVKYQDEYRRRLELIQDFDFPIACAKVVVSRDGDYIGAIGTYPPEVKVFDTSQLSLHFVRGFDAEAVDFLFLSPDYRKIVFLQRDRTLEFHSQGGRHTRIRIPSEGRSLAYVSQNAHLYVAASSSDLYRVDLEQGVFDQPLTSKCSELNFCVPNPTLPILVTGGSNGIVESWDIRTPTRGAVANFSATHQSDEPQANGDAAAATCASFSDDGMTLCVGTSSGICRIYDIRSSRPLVERDHRNDLPIVATRVVPKHQTAANYSDSQFETRGGHVIISSDTKSVKIWEALGSEQSKIKFVANIDAAAAINGIEHVPNSGLLFVPQDGHRIGTYFIPQLGIAPRWCSFLESLTEELEETAASTVYDEYQFVTAQQLSIMGAQRLIGSHLAKPYMHGYLIDGRLYGKLKAVAEPFAVEKYRKELMKKKLDAKRKMRIEMRADTTTTPKVNAALAAKLSRAGIASRRHKSTAKQPELVKAAGSILGDERFQDLFRDPDFQVEEFSSERR